MPAWGVERTGRVGDAPRKEGSGSRGVGQKGEWEAADPPFEAYFHLEVSELQSDPVVAGVGAEGVGKLLCFTFWSSSKLSQWINRETSAYDSEEEELKESF